MSTLIPLLEMVVLGLPIIYGLLRTLPKSERRRMAVVLFSAFALRLLTAVFFDTFESARLFHEDAAGYEINGRHLAAAWWGSGPPVHVVEEQGTVEYPGFLMFCGALYYVFGPFRLVVTAFMSLCGTITVFMVYRLASRIFHRVVAYRAALLTAFFPSMILWSAMALKDPIMIMLIAVTLDCMLDLRAAFRLRSVVLVVMCAVAMWFIRFYIVYALALASLVSIFAVRSRSFAKNLYQQLTIVILLVLVFSVLGVSRGFISAAETFDLARISDYRHGMAATANSRFAADADLSTPGRVIAFLPFGMSVLLLSPFPWQMTSMRPLLALPEMLVWWMMIPSLWRGIRFAVRRELVALAPVLGFGITLLTLYSLTLGNVGAAFRQRAQVFIFLFIFAALGHYVSLCRRRGIDENTLRIGA